MVRPVTALSKLPDVYKRIIVAAGVLTFVIIAGTTSYHEVGAGRWSYFDCFYMTVITLSTVGFGETLPGMAGVHEARLITLALIVAGSGTLLYFISNLTALIVEGDLQGLLRRRRMERTIEHLQNHVIVCGIGTTGRHIVRELSTAGTRFVVVDTNRERIEEMVEHMDGELLYILGDATDDAVMERAGITQCHGIIAALSDDRSNLFVTISARALNKTARIVAKAVEASTERKLYRAGADSVVSPNYIGGMRLANEMIRPKTVEFLDRILQDRDGNQLRIEEIAIPEGSSIFGRTLSQTRIRNTGALVLAVHQPDGTYVYNPKGDMVIVKGSGIVVLADEGALTLLHDALDRNVLTHFAG